MIRGYATVATSPQGDFMKLSLHGTGRQPTKTERGTINGFSRRSRSRLLQTLAKVKRHALPLFVTLTYHDDYPGNFEIYKYHLHHFFIKFFRSFPKAGAIWKLEYQKRGAPHYHLLVWGVSLDDLQSWVPGAWADIVAPGDGLLLRWHSGDLGNGHCVQSIHTWKGVKSYASKYFIKQYELAEGGTGRVWGVRGQVPFAEVISLQIDVRAALAWKRAILKIKGLRSRRFGFWVFGYHPDYWMYLQQMIDLYAPRAEDNPPPNFPPGWYKVGLYG